jgi:hypothetical protein
MERDLQPTQHTHQPHPRHQRESRQRRPQTARVHLGTPSAGRKGRPWPSAQSRPSAGDGNSERERESERERGRDKSMKNLRRGRGGRERERYIAGYADPAERRTPPPAGADDPAAQQVLHRPSKSVESGGAATARRWRGLPSIVRPSTPACATPRRRRGNCPRLAPSRKMSIHLTRIAATATVVA